VDERRIVALGGGGFSTEPENPLLDRFVLSLARSARPRVCFVPTASGDSADYVARFHRAFSALDCEPCELRLFERSVGDLRSFVLAQDVLYVGGGSTANLLAVWRTHVLDRIVAEAWEEGVVLCGISAGMNCWFEQSVTDSFDVARLAPLNDGLGLLAGSACPHYDGDEQRRPAFRRFVGGGQLAGGYAADDGAALVFSGRELEEVVGSRPGAAAYRVERSGDGVRERRLAARLLGSRVRAMRDPLAPGIDGFDYTTVAVGPTRYRPGVAGSGPPVLLLHGFPQTHYCWHRVAPELAAENTVVVCDLKGYGESRSAPGGPLGEGYSKREMATELVELMTRLGFDRFAVVGHDRGGRVGYRMALDHPGAVERLGVLNIVPTVDQFERMAGAASIDYYPWFFLAQPPPFPERLVGASAEYFLRHTLDSFAATPAAIAPEAAERYLRAFTPDVIAAICADYRAAFHVDQVVDAEDREAGRKIGCPVLAHWGAEEGSLSDGPLIVWRQWADTVEGGPLPSGHFIAEEAPQELLASLRSFLRAR
jgi:haloacetate dehalogenase